MNKDNGPIHPKVRGRVATLASVAVIMLASILVLVNSPDPTHVKLQAICAGTLAIAFAVSLFVAWPLFNTGYAVVFLPIEALVMLMGAGIGAISTRIPEARWRRATYGAWGAGLIAILLGLFVFGTIGSR